MSDRPPSSVNNLLHGCIASWNEDDLEPGTVRIYTAKARARMREQNRYPPIINRAYVEISVPPPSSRARAAAVKAKDRLARMSPEVQDSDGTDGDYRAAGYVSADRRAAGERLHKRGVEMAIEHANRGSEGMCHNSSAVRASSLIPSTMCNILLPARTWATIIQPPMPEPGQTSLHSVDEVRSPCPNLGSPFTHPPSTHAPRPFCIYILTNHQ
ncbi:hypothetical protein EV121DRAFT_297303 [Schizophyllum commune]